MPAFEWDEAEREHYRRPRPTRPPRNRPRLDRHPQDAPPLVFGRGAFGVCGAMVQ